jgi:hypothetical protein
LAGKSGDKVEWEDGEGTRRRGHIGGCAYSHCGIKQTSNPLSTYFNSYLEIPIVACRDILHPATMAQDIPTHCRAVVLEKVGAPWAIKEVPVKQPQAGEILIKVLACGICHSDSVLRQGHLGEVFPRIPGHEVIGTVVKVGEGEKKWKVGDRVGGGWHGAHDSVCRSCNRGLFQMCEKEEINGVTRDGGCELPFSLPCHFP